jgi:arginase family enzyme
MILMELREVTLLNFDNTYREQPQLSRVANQWIELQDIPGTNLYCSGQAWQKLTERIPEKTGRGITFIGNGNHHYVTYLFLQKFHQPFTLVLFDNHTDSQPLMGSKLLSCGSWVAEALGNLPFLQKVFLVGTCSKSKAFPSRLKNKIVLWLNRQWDQLVSAIPTEDIYISIDKDVLDRADAITNWDQGNMRLADLLAALGRLACRKKVLGVDVCGELPVSPAEVWSHRNELKRNETANLSILQQILSS